ncbi:hypothetical protein Ddye_027314 [Dipteronia dyeriana]|uniref:Bifunctional inhibitor/plant lipid transfer protein/seed storage helical domain-containing protein n=1 Tax=Dipteronia dyeriana TaxID=168575 RepID=A0AAD9TNU5_9ROSI|nr:hypothetical protein Ddye_027314 [Dipteronia dyeriana]
MQTLQTLQIYLPPPPSFLLTTTSTAMARPTSLVPILAAILLLTATNAYALRTTISAIVNDEVTNPNDHQQSSCREEIQSAYPRNCGLYITRSPLRIAYDMLCCSEMERLDNECQCEALEQLIQQVKVQAEKKQQMGRMDMKDVIKRAENVPVYCNLLQRCKFQSLSL